MRPKKPLIAAELSRLREKPPRATSREPLSQLDRLAILNGLRDGDAPARIATQCNISVRSVEWVKNKLYDNPLSLFDYNVVIHQGKGTATANTGLWGRNTSECTVFGRLAGLDIG